jgi:hypothetical protein
MANRYFKTGNATRGYSLSNGAKVKFEPCFMIASAWVGILRLSDTDPAADMVARLPPPVVEINRAEFEQIEKKKAHSPDSFPDMAYRRFRHPSPEEEGDRVVAVADAAILGSRRAKAAAQEPDLDVDDMVKIGTPPAPPPDILDVSDDAKPPTPKKRRKSPTRRRRSSST